MHRQHGCLNNSATKENKRTQKRFVCHCLLDSILMNVQKNGHYNRGVITLKIGIIDADLIAGARHRFPNLCSMKISAYHKSLGDDVSLKLDYENIEEYDKVYISKVFIKTMVPGESEDQAGKTEDTVLEWYSDNEFLKNPKIEYGGTGFFYHKAPPLKPEIEHMMPDYSLYDNWVSQKLLSGGKRSEFKYYLDYSIGYLTRKCFRGCKFCVNRDYRRVEAASPLEEFMDLSKPKLCFLDDNFFGYSNWGGGLFSKFLKVGSHSSSNRGWMNGSLPKTRSSR